MVGQLLPRNAGKTKKASMGWSGWLGLLLICGAVTSGAVFRSMRTRAEPNATSILLSGESVAQASLAVADFDGNGYKEIVAAGQDGMLYVIAYNGSGWSVVWERQTAVDLNAAGPPNPASTTEIRSSPAVADLDNDGQMEIVVTTGGDPGLHKNGGVLVYSYASSWSFSLVSGWPQPKLDVVGLGPGAGDPDGYWDGIWGSPALGDLDGDGDLEVAVEGFDRRLHAWHHDGTVVAGWPITRDNGDLLTRGGWSSPAIGDIDDDGLSEVVFGTDSPAWIDGQAPDYSKATLWAMNGDSTVVPGFPVTTDQMIQSSPALGDIDNDGKLEIVVGTGDGISGSGGHKVHAWNGDGTPVSGWPQPTIENMPAPPALGDITGDGVLDVVIGCGNGSGNCKQLYAWQGDGSPVSGFRMQPIGFNYWTDNWLQDPRSSAVLADYDGDGVVEIMVAVEGSWGITIIEPDGTNNPDQSRMTNGGLMSAPVIDDIDNDGKLETLVGGGRFDHATQQYSGGEITIWDEVGTIAHARPWPTFHHDMLRTGNVYGSDDVPPTNPTLSSPSHSVGTWSKDNTVQINLASATDDYSGVRGYYYAWNTSASMTLDKTAAFVTAAQTSITSYALADGNTHYFHLRTVDRAGNLANTTLHLGPFWIDAHPPASAASSSPFAAGSFPVTWQGNDVGPSGLASYDVDVRVGEAGSWTTWQNNVNASTTQALYTGSVGSTYYFRSLAQDVAGNVETSPSEADTSTKVTRYGFTGHVFNNREEPVFLAEVEADKLVVGTVPSDLEGAYGVFFDVEDTYQLTVQRSGFGTLPPKSVMGGSISGLDLFLPPAVDFIENGDFESGSLDSAWDSQGDIDPALAEVPHSGDRALLMQGPGTAVVSQTITLPSGLGAETMVLSWMTSVTGTAVAQDALTLAVEIDGRVYTDSVSLSALTGGNWTHRFLEVGVQSGQTARVRLMLDTRSAVHVYLDELSLGETHAGSNLNYLPAMLRDGGH